MLEYSFFKKWKGLFNLWSQPSGLCVDIYVDMYVDNVDIYICFPPHGNWNSGREMSSPSNAAPPNPIIVGCSYSLYSGKNVDLDSYPKTH